MRTIHTVTVKKSEVVTLAWLIRQDIPYPDIEGHGSLSWRNAGTLQSHYGTPASPLPKRYRAYLLPTVESDAPTRFNRTQLAGYDSNPAPLTLRGASLGEISAEITPWPLHMGGGSHVSYQVRGFSDPTPGERAWLDANITPHLVATVEAQAEPLHAEAVNLIHENLKERIDKAKLDLARLETEAAAMLAIA